MNFSKRKMLIVFRNPIEHSIIGFPSNVINIKKYKSTTFTVFFKSFSFLQRINVCFCVLQIRNFQVKCEIRPKKSKSIASFLLHLILTNTNYADRIKIVHESSSKKIADWDGFLNKTANTQVRFCFGWYIFIQKQKQIIFIKKMKRLNTMTVTISCWCFIAIQI